MFSCFAQIESLMLATSQARLEALQTIMMREEYRGFDSKPFKMVRAIVGFRNNLEVVQSLVMQEVEPQTVRYAAAECIRLGIYALNAQGM